ncbi:hypothetical protein KUCAC02_012524, partial [Chaenocephalus aceratus]
METALSVFAKPPRTIWSELVRDVRGLVLTAESTHALIRAAVRALFTLRAETLSLVRMCTTHPHLPRAVWTTSLRVEQELVTSYPQVVVVRVPTPWVQSDSDITVLRHLEKMG